METFQNNPLLSINNLTLGLQLPNYSLQLILSGVTLSLKQGKTLALVGESGSGKTMTSYSILRLLPENMRFSLASEINFQQHDFLSLSEREMQKIRGKKISMVFQEPMTSLNPVKKIGEQILEVLHQHRLISDRQSAYQHSVTLLKDVGIKHPERVFQAYPHQLSGGMKQRAVIAMALISEPDLLIADEPTSALDVTVQQKILLLLKKLQKKRKMAMLFITHDLTVVKRIADDIAVMYAGHIVEYRDVKNFFANPLHPYSRQLLASVPTLSGRNQQLSVIPGQVPKLDQALLLKCRFVNRCQFAQPICDQKAPPLVDTSQNHVRCWLYAEKNQQHFNYPYDVNQKNKDVYREVNEKANEVCNKAINSESIIHVKDLHVHFKEKKPYSLRKTIFKAVDGVSFSVPNGKTIAMVGESGSGKTTIAKAILQLIPITSGEINIAGQSFRKITKQNVTKLRKKAQIVFQDPFSSMNPRMTIANILAEGLTSLRPELSRTERNNKVIDTLEQVGLTQDILTRYPHEFSGGQRQRIAIARALLVEPEVIILDEPTSALDVSIQAQILNLLKELQENMGLAYLLISHNLAAVSFLAHDIVVLKDGCIVEQGTAEKIIHTPEHPYTQKLIEAAQ